MLGVPEVMSTTTISSSPTSISHRRSRLATVSWRVVTEVETDSLPPVEAASSFTSPEELCTEAEDPSSVAVSCTSCPLDRMSCTSIAPLLFCPV